MLDSEQTAVGIPRIRCFGEEEGCKYMAMDLLGLDLENFSIIGVHSSMGNMSPSCTIQV